MSLRSVGEMSIGSSEIKHSSIQQASGLPGPPQNISVTITGISTASINWTAPAILGKSSISGYTVETIPSGGTASVTGTSANISGLTSNTSYQFKVIPQNSVGRGVFSNSLPSTTRIDYSGIFITSTTWTPAYSGSYNVYVVGGGGGSSRSYGSSGGSGRYTVSTQTLSNSSTYNVTIGAGGAGGGNPGSAGGASNFNGVVSSNGGTGGSGGEWGKGTAGSGGSGGGGNAYASNGVGGGNAGFSGSNGQTDYGFGGTGQLSVAYLSGTNPNIPPGGTGQGRTAPSYSGINNLGGGSTITEGRGRGGYSTGWQANGGPGVGGMVVYEYLG